MVWIQLRCAFGLCPDDITFRFGHELLKKVIDWLKGPIVAFLCEVQEVQHIMMGYGAIGLDESRIYVDQLCSAVAFKILPDEFIDFGIPLS